MGPHPTFSYLGEKEAQKRRRATRSVGESRKCWEKVLERIVKIEMAIILPTGQWYALSAIINDAWCCMVLQGIALY